MNGYLMDTNHVTAWEAQVPALVAKLQALPANTRVCTCAITLGEIAQGHEMTNGDLQRRHQVKQFLNIWVNPYVVKLSDTTGAYYGQIIGRIWKRTSPASKKISTDEHLVKQGVNINDVWIVACAWEHGLTLLTTDGMTAIRNVTPEVTFDNWCI